MNENGESIEIRLSINVDYNDYKRFVLYHGRKTIIIEILFIIAAYVGTLVYLILSDDELLDLSLFLLIMIPLGIITIAVVIFVLRQIALYRIKRIYKSDKLFQKLQNYTINDTGIKMESESGNGTMKWDEVFRVDESKDSFLIYLSRIKALMLPKKFFDNDEQMKLFRKLVRFNMPSKKVKFRQTNNQ